MIQAIAPVTVEKPARVKCRCQLPSLRRPSSSAQDLPRVPGRRARRSTPAGGRGEDFVAKGGGPEQAALVAVVLFGETVQNLGGAMPLAETDGKPNARRRHGWPRLGRRSVCIWTSRINPAISVAASPGDSQRCGRGGETASRPVGSGPVRAPAGYTEGNRGLVPRARPVARVPPTSGVFRHARGQIGLPRLCRGCHNRPSGSNLMQNRDPARAAPCTQPNRRRYAGRHRLLDARPSGGSNDAIGRRPLYHSICEYRQSVESGGRALRAVYCASVSPSVRRGCSQHQFTVLPDEVVAKAVVTILCRQLETGRLDQRARMFRLLPSSGLSANRADAHPGLAGRWAISLLRLPESG